MRTVRAVVILSLLAAMCSAQTPGSHASTALVTIRGTGENGQPVSGTGFVVAPNGTIVTNLHLVKGLANPHVQISTGDIFDAFTIVSSDTRRDLAIVRIAGFDLPYIALGNSNQVQAGDIVLLVEAGKQASPATVSGMVAGDGFRLIQTSAAPEAGSAGGLLLNASGEVIGVLGYRSDSAKAVAVPINYARGLLDSAALPVVAAKPATPPRVAAAAPITAPVLPRTAEPAPPRPTEAAKPAPPEPQAVPAPPAKVAPAAAPAETAAPATEQPEVAEPAAPAPAAPKPEASPAATTAPEYVRPSVRKIYVASLGSGEGPDMLRDKIAHHLQENNFVVVDNPIEADAVLSGTGKWNHVRVQRFQARLVAAGERVLWSGEVSSGGWIRSASTSVANKLVDEMMRALATGAPR